MFLVTTMMKLQGKNVYLAMLAREDCYALWENYEYDETTQQESPAFVPSVPQKKPAGLLKTIALSLVFVLDAYLLLYFPITQSFFFFALNSIIFLAHNYSFPTILFYVL